MKLHGRRGLRALALLAVLALFAASCGDDDTVEAPPTTPPVDDNGDDVDGVEPVRGGTLTLSMFSQPSGLDPIGASGSGTAGGTELKALYDTIMAWNTETLEYEFRTGESLEHNDDFTEWTLTLRDGITFRDGTPYDAEAVALSFERHKSPQNVRNPSRAHLAVVESWEVLDELTIRFQLSEPWPAFPYSLSREPGMLVSPAVIAALGDPDDPGWRDRFEEHNRHPEGAGAGPFEIVEFRPGEVLIMRKDPNFWGGEPYVDELRFVVLPGAAQNLEALNTGNIDVGFIRSADIAHEAREQGFEGLDVVVSAGDLLLINNGVEVTCSGGEPAAHCAGQPDGTVVATDTPGQSLKVRQAVAHAIDSEVINRRVYDGVGYADKALFHESFAWNPGVPGPEFDRDRAIELVEEAKAEGWDGRIRLVSTRTPERIAFALAIESMLRDVGMDVQTSTDLEVVDHITLIITRKDFDLSAWGIALHPDDGAALALLQNWFSTSPTNRVGYKSERMDAAIVAARQAVTDADKVAAYGEVARVYNEEVPSLVIGAQSEFIAWRAGVHGIYAGVANMFYLDKAWIEQ